MTHASSLSIHRLGSSCTTHPFLEAYGRAVAVICSGLHTRRHTFPLFIPDNQRCKSHVSHGLFFLSRKVYKVHVKHNKAGWKHVPSSSEAEACRGGSHSCCSPPTRCQLFDFGLLRQVLISFQITLGYVVGDLSLGTAIQEAALVSQCSIELGTSSACTWRWLWAGAQRLAC